MARSGILREHCALLLFEYEMSPLTLVVVPRPLAGGSAGKFERLHIAKPNR